MPTYMKCRIMHVEVTHTLDTDSFIMALMRFITQRENVQTMFKKNSVFQYQKSADKSITGNGQPKSSSVYASVYCWLGQVEEEPLFC